LYGAQTLTQRDSSSNAILSMPAIRFFAIGGD
jgi:hypothetical protein